MRRSIQRRKDCESDNTVGRNWAIYRVSTVKICIPLYLNPVVPLGEQNVWTESPVQLNGTLCWEGFYKQRNVFFDGGQAFLTHVKWFGRRQIVTGFKWRWQISASILARFSRAWITADRPTANFIESRLSLKRVVDEALRTLTDTMWCLKRSNSLWRPMQKFLSASSRGHYTGSGWTLLRRAVSRCLLQSAVSRCSLEDPHSHTSHEDDLLPSHDGLSLSAWLWLCSLVSHVPFTFCLLLSSA